MKVQEIVDEYLHVNPDEKEGLHHLVKFLKVSDNIFSRKNFDGHITGSAFIVNESSKQVLLLEHKNLGRMLQPGGHVEDIDKTILHSVMREIEEETGLTSEDLSPRSIVASKPEVPFDIDIHEIPSNSKKAEPKHYHHDFRYLFTTSNSNVKFNPQEVTSYKWIDWADFMIDKNFQYLADKIESVIEPNVHDYFKSLVTADSHKYSVVVVSHLIPSSEDYLEALHENFNLIGVIPKPTSINQSTQAEQSIKGCFWRFSRSKFENERADWSCCSCSNTQVRLCDRYASQKKTASKEKN